MRKALLGIGIGLFLIGLFMGAAPASITAGGVPGDCGAPWSPSYRDADLFQAGYDLSASTTVGLETADYRGQCDEALGSRGSWAAVLASFGALMLLGASLLYVHQRSSTSLERAPVEP